MSSSKESSNPQDYIEDHSDAYENIMKLGEDALLYMLSEFKVGNARGLRGQIMMELYKELLGERNNVINETLSPQQWYDALSIREEIQLPNFQYDGDNLIERLVYATEIEKTSQPQSGFTVVASKIFNSYEKENLLKVFMTTYSKTYKLYGNRLEDISGSVVPVAIVYRKMKLEIIL